MVAPSADDDRLAQSVASRTILFGAIAWIATFQFFVVQLVVQLAWRTPFHLTQNYISDLGNTACAPFPPGSTVMVCSPWHSAMNASFVLTGVLLMAGSALSRAERETPLGASGLTLVALAGVGFMLVGFFPENVRTTPHRFGAALHFVGGNLGLVLLGIARLRGRPQQTRGAFFAIAAGALGLLATGIFITGHDLGAGRGGVERLAAYPLPLWTTITGISIARVKGANPRA